MPIDDPLNAPDPSTPAPVGVIFHDNRSEAEEVLARFTRHLQASGVDVGGLIQKTGKDPDGKVRMELVDVRTGERYPISQDLGSGARACCVSPNGLADASQVLRREIEHRPALLVVNKFSGMEIDGTGLAAEMFEAIAEGVPLLTTLAVRHKAQWDAATGGAGTMLPPDEAALRAWWREAQGS